MFAPARRLVRNGLLLLGVLVAVAGTALPGSDAAAARRRPDLVLRAKFGNVLEVANAGDRATTRGFVVRVENLTQGGAFFESVDELLRPGESVDISFFACPPTTFRFTADANNDIRERNERNNVLTATMDNC
jgi:CARDB